jgi:hypothetical protein
VAAQKERGAGAAWAQAAYLLVISLADYLLLATTRWLGRLEKHKTRTALEASIMVRTGRGVRVGRGAHAAVFAHSFNIHSFRFGWGEGSFHSTFIHFGSGGERGHFIQHSFISVRVGGGAHAAVPPRASQYPRPEAVARIEGL